MTVAALVVVAWRYLPAGGDFTDDEEVEDVVVEARELREKESFGYGPLSPSAAAATAKEETKSADSPTEEAKVATQAWAALMEPELVEDLKVVIDFDTPSITTDAGNGDALVLRGDSGPASPRGGGIDLVREDSAWSDDLPPPPLQGTSSAAAAAFKDDPPSPTYSPLSPSAAEAKEAEGAYVRQGSTSPDVWPEVERPSSPRRPPPLLLKPSSITVSDFGLDSGLRFRSPILVSDSFDLVPASATGNGDGVGDFVARQDSASDRYTAAAKHYAISVPSPTATMRQGLTLVHFSA